jgi:hypothetical protein
VTALRRTANGNVSIEKAVAPTEVSVENAVDPKELLPALRAISVSDETSEILLAGIAVNAPEGLGN